MDLDPEQLRLFWWTARERQAILLRRRAGQPREAWTQDPVFRSHHFCNVFRSDDRVSAAILRLGGSWDDPWAAALAGRLVNRYETIQVITELPSAPVPGKLAAIILNHGLNTNAYRLNTPRGLNSAVGLVEMYEAALPLGPEVREQLSIPAMLGVMVQVSCLGGFVGYQVASDLIEMAAIPPGFRDDWAWAGPGAARGAMRLLGETPSGSWEERSVNRPEVERPAEVQAVMSELLSLSRDRANWPPHWRPWTIHEVEGWLCEYDKWARRANGESAGGRRYKGVYGVDYQPRRRVVA